MIATQFIKSKNPLLNEDMVQARIVHTQTMDFDEWCERLTDGSIVTPAHVAAVMRLLDDKLPELLCHNIKMICSPAGLTIRPVVKGSITQKQLRDKLKARLTADPSYPIDTDREISTSDLLTSDCSVDIVVTLPKKWLDRFRAKATLKRV